MASQAGDSATGRRAVAAAASVAAALLVQQRIVVRKMHLSRSIIEAFSADLLAADIAETNQGFRDHGFVTHANLKCVATL